MAVQKIKYENKTYLQNDANVPEKNKVTEDNMNEIKNVINENADELITAQENIENLQSEQGTASTDITNLKNRVNTLETDNTKNKQDIANKVDKVDGKGLSTNDFTNEEKQKLAGLSNYNDEPIKQDIQDLQTNISNIKSEQLTQNDLIERLKDNQINITTEKSSSINVKDCSNLPAKVNVFGISEQETRSGKNKLPYPYNDLSGTIIEDKGNGQLILNGTLDSNTSKTIQILNLKAGNYKFLFNNTNLPNNSYFYIKNIDTSTMIKTNAKTNTTFTLESDTNLNITLVLVQGTYSNYKLDLMILESTEEDETFERYGASPSPEYPSEIENVEGNVDITVCNKNLLPILNLNTNWQYTENGIKNILKNDTVKLTEFNLKKGQTIKIGLKLISKPSTETTFSFFVDNIPNTIANYTKINTYNINQIYEKTYTATKDCIISYRMYGNSNSDIFEFQLWGEINNLTDYVQYEQQTITFPLQEGQKLYEGDYLADDGIHHVRDVYIFKAVTSLASYNNNNYGTNASVINSVNTANILSDRIIGSDAAKENTGYITGNGKTVVIYGNSTDTVESFNEKFVGTKIEYPLAKEKIELYTEEQQEAYNKLQNVLPYKTVTNVFTDKALLEFKYVADTETWVLNEIKPLKEQINTIKQLLSTTNTSALLLDNMQLDLESEVV